MSIPQPTSRPDIRQRAKAGKSSRDGEPVVPALGRAWVEPDGGGRVAPPPRTGACRHGHEAQAQDGQSTWSTSITPTDHAWPVSVVARARARAWNRLFSPHVEMPATAVCSCRFHDGHKVPAFAPQRVQELQFVGAGAVPNTVWQDSLQTLLDAPPNRTPPNRIVHSSEFVAHEVTLPALPAWRIRPPLSGRRWLHVAVVERDGYLCQ